MTKTLMTREQRRRKRQIYFRAVRATNDLVDALRDMREFARTMEDKYGETPDAGRCVLVYSSLDTISLHNKEDELQAILDSFNRMSEDI